MKRFTLAQLLALVIVLATATALVMPAIARAREDHRREACGNNLKQLWTMHINYVCMFSGGRRKLMSSVTGGDFWVFLTRTTPPLIDHTLNDVFDCPLSSVVGGRACCEYRGPATDVNGCDDDRPIGTDRTSNHRDGGNVLWKSGELRHCAADDPLWHRAMETTSP